MATNTAISGSRTDVNNAINGGGGFTALNDGDICVIPVDAGQNWTTGVAVTKAIKIQGAGSGRIISYDDGNQTGVLVGTGTKTWTISGYSPGFSSSSITAGQTLRAFANNHRGNWMEGTVTSLSSGTLTMNITSTAGSGTFHRWIFATSPLTTIINATTGSTELFQITESTAGHVDLSGIQFGMTTRQAAHIKISHTSGGKSVLIHDCWFQLDQDSFENIDTNVNRGVIWNCSFQASSNNDAQLITAGDIRIKDDAGTAIASSSWSSVSTFGANDTTGESNFYIETCDFHCFQAITDMDSGARFVFRYNLQDHSTVATHGADSSNWGCRHGEIYNNPGVFYGYGNGTTFNMPNGWFGLVRGGTFATHDNTWPDLSCSDYPNPKDVKLCALNLKRSIGPNSCWGYNTTNGAQYPCPRQVGMGYVTGTGVDGLGRTNDSIGYVGDSEPLYFWNNSRSLVFGYVDGTPADCGPNGETVLNYIVVNRDYFASATKPSYTPYTYPHPLTQTTPSIINRQPMTHRRIRGMRRR